MLINFIFEVRGSNSEALFHFLYRIILRFITVQAAQSPGPQAPQMLHIWGPGALSWAPGGAAPGPLSSEWQLTGHKGRDFSRAGPDMSTVN